jgi:hypothetical protein
MPLGDALPIIPHWLHKNLQRLKIALVRFTAYGVAKWQPFGTFLDVDVRITLMKLPICGKQLFYITFGSHKRVNILNSLHTLLHNSFPI